MPDFEVPYHTDIMERLNGIDLDSARRTSGNGFYYLMGDVARLHEGILAFDTATSYDTSPCSPRACRPQSSPAFQTGGCGRLPVPQCHANPFPCPRMLIAFLENNLQADGSVTIPQVLRPYMGGLEIMVPKK